MIDILDRVRSKALQAKIVTAEEAAAYFKPGMNVATSGFTASSYPKAVPLALAERMKKEPFTINLWTGASTGPELDDALAQVHADAVANVPSIHRTFLEADGAGGMRKARDLRSPKQAYSEFRGGIIPVWRGDSGKPIKDAPAGEWWSA